MENFLSGDGAVGQEEIDPLTAQATAPQGFGYALSHAEQLRAGLCGKIGQIGGVDDGNDQHMPRIDRLDVHEGAAKVISVDDARGELVR